MRMMFGLLAALALAVPAAAQDAKVFDQSWSSRHWSLQGIFGDAPKRVAFIVDRESIRPVAGTDAREFSYLVTTEGMAPDQGIISRLRVNCGEMSRVDLGKVEYFGGEPNLVPSKSGEALVIKPDAALYDTLKGVCTGDWGDSTVLDVPATELHARIFES